MVASALKLPVRTEEFTGSEDDARHFIVSANLIRRSLTMAQRVMLVRDILLPQAEAEARERRIEGNTRGGSGQDSKSSAELRSTSEPEPSPRPEPKKASQVAAERSMGLASPRNIEYMKDVDDAPETRERIRRGEIKTAKAAAEAAAAELGKTEVPEPEPETTLNRTAWTHLGKACYLMRSAVEQLQGGKAGPGDHSPAESGNGSLKSATMRIRQRNSSARLSSKERLKPPSTRDRAACGTVPAACITASRY